MLFEHHNPPYHAFQIHDLMLSDAVRTESYKRAIEENVAPGDVVIDFGAGTGILALFAAKAGARKVYAIERTSIIEVAKRLAEENGVDDVVEFIRADARDVTLAEKADVIVSEWIGVFVFQENMLPDLLLLRDKFLKPEGKLLPEKVELFLAPVHTYAAYYETAGKWKEGMYELSLGHVASQQSAKEHLVDLSESELISTPHTEFELDLCNVTHTDNVNYYIQDTFEVEKGNACDGLGGWFVAYFPGMEVIDTSPEKPGTSWQQTYFPLLDPIEVRKHQKLSVEFSISIDSTNRQRAQFQWGVKSKNGVHSTSGT